MVPVILASNYHHQVSLAPVELWQRCGVIHQIRWPDHQDPRRRSGSQIQPVLPGKGIIVPRSAIFGYRSGQFEGASGECRVDSIASRDRVLRQ